MNLIEVSEIILFDTEVFNLVSTTMSDVNYGEDYDLVVRIVSHQISYEVSVYSRDKIDEVVDKDEEVKQRLFEAFDKAHMKGFNYLTIKEEV